MKLRMARNSLFAILLRQRWWVSFGVGVAIALVSGALLPRDLALMAIFMPMPFWVIAGMAAWQQRHRPSAAQLAQAVEELGRLSWPVFSQRLRTALEKQGVAVTELKTPGADFEWTEGHRKIVLAARRWKAARTGIEPLRELQAAAEAREAQQAWYLSLGTLSEAAQDHARVQGIRVIGAEDIVTLLGR
jgi:restriction system protein